jgi:uncharacterized protein (DUF302 family)
MTVVFRNGERDLGLPLPCNVIVYADDVPGRCVVAASLIARAPSVGGLPANP